MNKHLLLLFSLFILYACNTKQENKTNDKATSQDTLAPLQVTVIANLPDSLQPKIISLDSMPKPKTVSAGKGETKMLPVLQNEKGETLLDTEGKPFILGDGGKSNFTNFTTDNGLALDAIFCSIEDKSGNLWFGTGGGGVSRYDGNCEAITNTNKNEKNAVSKSFSTFTTAQGLAGNDVRAILEDKSGNLWFGTNGGGVSRYDPSASLRTGTPSFSTFTTAQGLANNNVWSILEDKSGNLWFGTEEGLSILPAADLRNLDSYRDNSKGILTSTTFKSFKITDGLPDNFVTQVIQLPNGKIAIGTNLGITIFNHTDDLTKLTHLEIYNSPTGYPVKDVNVGQNCMLLDSKGIIWAGTGSEKTGLVRFDYAALHRNMEPPVLLIQSIKVKDENICWYNLQSKGLRLNNQDSTTALLQEFLSYGRSLSTKENDSILKRFGNIQFDGITKFYPLPENLVLPYEHNQISFEFAAIETSRPYLVKYQYMLEGYDEDWSPVTNKSNASFGNISEGTYTFKLKAKGANGVWTKPITYTFKVLPPWYRTWWMYIVYGILAIGLVVLIVWWNGRILRARAKELEVEVDKATVVIRKQKEVVEAEKKKSDDLLLNILPAEVAEELKEKGSAEARLIDEVTVLFTDFKGFTQLSEKLSPQALVAEINDCFSSFDHIMQKHGVEKIKTIGDAYMAAGGLPTPNATHATDVVNAALEIQKYMVDYKLKKEVAGELFFEIRIGVHTGPVVAGIVGVKKYSYDIWGDTVNTASRMESSGEAGKVNISGSTYELVKDKFNCVHRGKIAAKNKGEVDMYFVAIDIS